MSDEVVADCLRSLKAKQADVKFLGSYPAAGDAGHEVRADADEAAKAADEWIDALRGQVSSGRG